jgi:hypothetical protein
MEASERLSPAERRRIEFLIRRDGRASARDWVERTLKMYRSAVENTDSHASNPHYRPLFEASIYTFEKWLSENR